MAVVASAPLTAAAYHKCTRELAKGEVKRCVQRGPLIGYFMACPACGFSAAYLHDDVDYEEDPPSVEPKYPKRITAINKPPACFMCKRKLVVANGQLEAHE